MLRRTVLVASATAALVGAQTQERMARPAERVSIVSDIAHAEFGTRSDVVKNAPYQAEAVTETIQMLSDGNRIVRRNSASVARDSEGRTRRDIAMSGVAAKLTVIHDPVANVSYTLDHDKKIARKMKGRGMTVHIESAGTEGNVRMQKMPADVIMFEPAAAAPVHVQRDVLLEGGPAAFNVRMHDRENGKSESLGKQTFDGVVADGTRITNTIPTGEIGNERPIEIVFERWYSSELQTLISSTHKDPMIGETTYKLVNLNRNEPLKSMFEPPSGYTVQEAPEPPHMFMRRSDKKE